MGNSMINFLFLFLMAFNLQAMHQFKFKKESDLLWPENFPTDAPVTIIDFLSYGDKKNLLLVSKNIRKFIGEKILHVELNGRSDNLNELCNLFKDLPNIESLRCYNFIHDSLEKFSYLKNLKDLQFYLCDELNDKGIMPLSLLTNLENIEIKSCKKVTSESLIFFTSLTKLKSFGLNLVKPDILFSSLKNLLDLEGLALHGIHFKSGEELSFLTDLSKLKTLNIGYIEFKPDEENIGLLTRFCNLRELRLGFDSNPKTISFLNQLTTLESLVFFWSYSILQRYAKALDLPNLKYLDLSHVENHNISIRNLTNLETLLIGGDIDLKEELIYLTKLTCLSLKDIYDSEFDHVICLTNLKSLNISGGEEFAKDKETFQKITNLKNLTKLNISDCQNLRTVDLNHINKLTKLKYLDISKNVKLAFNSLNYLTDLINIKSIDYLYTAIAEEGYEKYLEKIKLLQDDSKKSG